MTTGFTSAGAMRQRKPVEQGYYDGYRGRDPNPPSLSHHADSYIVGYLDGQTARAMNDSE